MQRACSSTECRVTKSAVKPLDGVNGGQEKFLVVVWSDFKDHCHSRLEKEFEKKNEEQRLRRLDTNVVPLRNVEDGNGLTD